ncbi:MAG TPA: hypothetical protein VMW52_11990 [Phycisphaerae bacterium]|nr:hypothetical protein [Phycisphaerae bacterium]
MNKTEIKTEPDKWINVRILRETAEMARPLAHERRWSLSTYVDQSVKESVARANQRG